MKFNENLAYLNYFGVEITFWKTLNRLLINSNGKLASLVNDLNNTKIETYIKNVCPKTYQKLQTGLYDTSKKVSYHSNIKKNNIIWTMWWQGEENAPMVIKECINSMRLHSNGHQVIVLSEKNYKDFVNLPEHILDRFMDGSQDKTHLSKCTLTTTELSNLIRLYVLSRYGGVWADASILFTDTIDDIFFDKNWNTLGQDNEWYIGKGKWSTFFMSAHAGNGFCQFCYDMYIEYWETQKYWINYLMFDHIFDIAYKERPCFQKMVDTVSCGNKKCLTVNRLYNKKCNVKEAESLLKNQSFHKLSWKWGITNKNDLITDNGEYTWLGYFLENYKNI